MNELLNLPFQMYYYYFPVPLHMYCIYLQGNRYIVYFVLYIVPLYFNFALYSIIEYYILIKDL